MAMGSGEKNCHTLFSNQELQLWEQTACNKHLNQSLWEFCYWLWSKQVWGPYYGSCDSVCGFLMAKISHGQLETKDFIFGLKKKGMKKNSILLFRLAFILKGMSLKKNSATCVKSVVFRKKKSSKNTTHDWSQGCLPIQRQHSAAVKYTFYGLLSVLQ